MITKNLKKAAMLALVVMIALAAGGCGKTDGAGQAEQDEMNTILVTGFEPFGGEETNPAQNIVEKLPDKVGGCRIEKIVLPVEFVGAREAAFDKYDEVKPDAVIMLGQAGGRESITPESTAVNEMHAVASNGTVVPDNAGYAPVHEPVVEGGDDELYSTFPADRIADAVKAAGVPCERSDDAGRYVCNTLLYGMLEHNRGKVPTIFIHVPYASEQGHDDQPSIPLDEMYDGIVAAIKAVGEDL